VIRLHWSQLYTEQKQQMVCASRLEALGLWESGDHLRQTMQQSTMARRRVYEGLAAQLETNGLHIGMNKLYDC
jgi:hypothetical protein